ncbi:hypothetical protein B0H63DRAFT_520764 [Podospora didyma]|uniref:Uncharacterized protein n=1 Tax=Podospora didyma TaxID=330526 RepID=A0AAE0NS57_9PEZI|nr:hypothetical protein B0H63DRAFT_520764 [Podospora didyma]
MSSKEDIALWSALDRESMLEALLARAQRRHHARGGLPPPPLLTPRSRPQQAADVSLVDRRPGGPTRPLPPFVADELRSAVVSGKRGRCDDNRHGGDKQQQLNMGRLAAAAASSSLPPASATSSFPSAVAASSVAQPSHDRELYIDVEKMWPDEWREQWDDYDDGGSLAFARGSPTSVWVLLRLLGVLLLSLAATARPSDVSQRSARA